MSEQRKCGRWGTEGLLLTCFKSDGAIGDWPSEIMEILELRRAKPESGESSVAL